MADALSARDAYLAGAHDVELAQQATDLALSSGDILPDETAQFFQDALAHLWQGRIDRGELIPDTIPQGRAA